MSKKYQALWAFTVVLIMALTMLAASMSWFRNLREFTAPLEAAFRPRKNTVQDECPVVQIKRSHWYGASAFPVATEAKVWNWILYFLVFPNLDVRTRKNFTRQVVTTINKSDRSSRDFRQITFLRFTGASKSAVFHSIAAGIAGTTQLDQVDILRQFCNSTACRSTSVLPKLISHDVIFINAVINDVYDISQLIACAARAEYLVLTITTEPGLTGSERYPYDLHDLLNALFFEYDWIPFATESSQCRKRRYGCTLFTAWKKFRRGDNFSYFPPAADGGATYEIKRLASYLENPDPGNCHRRELIGAAYNDDVYIPRNDGQYAVCMDRMKHRDPSSCLVYSFGIGGIWSFEDAVHRLGCSVFSFDPSLNLPDHKRDDNHYFYSRGLVTDYASVPSGWNISTLKDIYEELEHKGRKISLLKMDCETPELTFIDSPGFDEMAPFIEQFALEVHYFPGHANSPQDMVWTVARVLHKLEKLGFEMYYSRPPLDISIHLDFRSFDGISSKFTGSQTIVYELAYINNNKL